MNTSRVAAISTALLLPLLITISGNIAGCKKDEPPPPMPEGTAQGTAPVQTIDVPVDAPEEVGDADADAKPTGGGGSNIMACCNALANAAGQSPPPNNMYLKAAADYCMGASKAPNTRQTLSQIAGMLRGASLPGACR